VITLEIAGWRVGLACQSEDLADALAARYGAFLTEASPQFAATVEWDSGSAMSHPVLEWNSGSEVVLQGSANAYLLDAPSFCGRIDMVRAEATFSFRGRTPLADIEHCVRTLYALLADREGGLLVHAAGVLTPASKDPSGATYSNGRALLFIGSSGSGKSTIVGLSPHAKALNDDLVLLRPQDGRWIAYGTPFWNAETAGHSSETACGPLVGIYRLVQDQDVFLERCEPAAATAELVANCPVVNGDPGRLPGLLARCSRLAKAVPVQRLHFRKDSGFWELL
jgi:hypothetical protein